RCAWHTNPTSSRTSRRSLRFLGRRAGARPVPLGPRRPSEPDRPTTYTRVAVRAEVTELHRMPAVLVHQRGAAVDVTGSPCGQRTHHEPEVAPSLRQLVGGARGMVGVERPPDEPVLLHHLEALGEDVRRDAG